MADDQTPKRTPKRPRFFKSQFLELRDFEDEQTYHLEMLRRHNRGLHGWGIVRDGLQVTLSSDKTGLLISPGSAIDNQGQEIVLDKEGVLFFQKKDQRLKWNGNAYELSSKQIKEAAVFTGSPVDFYLTITFQEDKSDAPGDQYPPPGGKVDFTRWQQTPLLQLEKTLRDDGSSIKLARVNVTKDGTLDPPDMSVRPLAGCLGPLSLTSGDGKAQFGIDYHAQSDALRIRARAKDASALDATHITIKRDTGNVGIGTDTPSGRIDVRDSKGKAFLWNSDKKHHSFFGATEGGTAHLTGNLCYDDQIDKWNRLNPKKGGSVWWAGHDGTLGALQIGDGDNPVNKEFSRPLFIDASGNVGIGAPDPQAKLDVRGDLKVSGTIYGAGKPLAYENYEIYLRGSAGESSEGAETFLKIANIPMSMGSPGAPGVRRGLNTVILNRNGTYKSSSIFDVYDHATSWHLWADYVANNAAVGDVVAVVSYDAISDAPLGGAAGTLLNFIGATQAFRAVTKADPTGGNFGRVSYALLFIRGNRNSIEVCTSYKGPNAHIKTSYYSLRNLRISSGNLSFSAEVKHNERIPVPWGTTADWNILLSPKQVGAADIGQEGNYALLKIECWPEDQDSYWLVHSQFKFRYANEDGKWFPTSTNYLLVPK